MLQALTYHTEALGIVGDILRVRARDVGFGDLDVYDRYLCDQMARNAVHAAMAGKTGVMIGSASDHIVHVPIPTVVAQTKAMEVDGDLWRAVLQSTAQPRW